jgi:hypothetical protein
MWDQPEILGPGSRTSPWAAASRGAGFLKGATLLPLGPDCATSRSGMGCAARGCGHSTQWPTALLANPPRGSRAPWGRPVARGDAHARLSARSPQLAAMRCRHSGLACRSSVASGEAPGSVARACPDAPARCAVAPPRPYPASRSARQCTQWPRTLGQPSNESIHRPPGASRGRRCWPPLPSRPMPAHGPLWHALPRP